MITSRTGKVGAVLAACVGLGMNQASAQATVKAFGLDHTALGQAEVGQSPGTTGLSISNIGSSGEDGVSIDLGGSGGWEGTLGSYDLPEVGSQVTTEFIATIDGIPGQVMATATLENEGDQIGLSVDFSGIGTTQILVSAFDEAGTLVAEFPITNGGVIPLFTPDYCPPPGVWTTVCKYTWGMTCENPPKLGWVWTCSNQCLPTVPGGGGGGDNPTARMIFTVLDQSTPVWALTEVDLTAASVGPLSIESEAIQFEASGSFVSAMGDVTLNANAGALEISNIGSSGQDGVSIDLGGVGKWDADWEDFDSPDLAPGAEMSTVLFGDVDGQADVLVGTTTAVKVADGETDLYTDFSAIGATTLRYDFLLAGEWVTSAENHPNDEPLRIIGEIHKDSHYSIIGTGEPCFEPIYPCLFAGYTWYAQTLGGPIVLLNGVGYPIDEVRAYPEDATAGMVERMNSVQINAADIPTVLLLNSVATPLPVVQSPCAGDANTDLTVDPLDAGYVQARFGCEVGSGDANCDQADQNEDGAVDPLDVGFVLARFGPCDCK